MPNRLCNGVLALAMLTFLPHIVSAQNTYWMNTDLTGFGDDFRCFAANSRGDVFAGTWNGGEVWKTTDNGLSWSRLAPFPDPNPVLSLVVNPRGQIFASVWLKGIYRSTDNGASWQLKSAGLPWPQPTVRGTLLDKSGNIWVATEAGLFRSSNNGDSWLLKRVGVFALVYLDSAGAILAAEGTPTIGTTMHRSFDSGITWSTRIVPYGLGVEGIHPDGSYFCASFTASIFRSTDFGATYVDLNTHMTWNGYTGTFTFNKRGDIFYAKNGDEAGILISTDMGASWTIRNDGLPNTHVMTMFYHPNGYVFVGMGGSGVLRSRFPTDHSLMPWGYSNTGVSHTVIIPKDIPSDIAGSPLQPGDFIGVFFDSSGTLACAGYEQWPESTNISVSAFGDDPTTPAKDGLANGEVFKWKVLRSTNGKIIDAQAVYIPVGGIVTSTDSFTPNGISRLESLSSPSVAHEITLRPGWSLISSYAAPESTSLDFVFKSVVSDLIIVKNGLQKTYIPSVPVNTIGPWVRTEGYQIKMENAGSLVIEGPKIVPEQTPITLPKGWSIFPYLEDTDLSVFSALNGIVTDIAIVKDQDGRTYIPSIGVNSIETLKPGMGYQIKMLNPRILTYPNLPLPLASGPVTITQSGNTMHSAGQPWTFTNTGSNHTIILPLNINPIVDGVPLSTGDRVGIFFDSSGTLTCAGYAEWTGTGNLVLSAFGDDPTTLAKDGLSVGETFAWKIWRHGDGRVFDARATYVASGGLGGLITDTSAYTTNGISALTTLSSTVTSVTDKPLPLQFALGNNYPNPFNPSTVIPFDIPKTSHVTLTIWNMLGQKVVTLVDEILQPGSYKTRFTGSDCATGVYLCRMRAGDFIQLRKLVLMR